MPKEYTFSTKHDPTNDLYEIDLEAHMNQMATAGWELVSTGQMICAPGSTTPQMILFWGKDH